jgi:hypothetical protein
MNWGTVFFAMLPEHLLLAGIVMLIINANSVARPAARRDPADRAGSPLRSPPRPPHFTLATSGYAAAPFAGQFSVDTNVFLRQGRDTGAGAAGAAAVARRLRRQPLSISCCCRRSTACA